MDSRISLQSNAYFVLKEYKSVSQFQIELQAGPALFRIVMCILVERSHNISVSYVFIITACQCL